MNSDGTRSGTGGLRLPVKGRRYLLAQQLVAAGETVVDVPTVLSTRTRLLGSGRAQKNDPNDARSVAITALRTDELG
jgi:transposase